MSHTVIPRKRAEPSAVDQKKGTMITLHAHGDGTYHSTSSSWDGDGRTEHPTFGHFVAHAAKLHATGDHMHIHGHDNGFTTHHVMEDGKKVAGPHEHKTVGALKKHVGKVMDNDGDYDGPDGAD